VTAQQGTLGITQPARVAARPGPLARLVGWRLSDQVIQGVLTAAVMVVAARSLGPAGLGELSFVLAIGAMLTPIITTHNQVVVHDFVATPHERRSILGASLVYGLVLALVLFAVLVVVALTVVDNPTIRTALIVGATALPATALTFGEGALQADVRGREIAIARSGSSLVGAVCKVGALVGGAGAVGFVTAGSAQVVLAAVALGLFARRMVDDAFPLRVDWVRVRNLARRSLPLALSAFSISIYLLFDQVVLGFMSDDAELGRYAAAVRIAIAPVVLPMALMTSATPGLAALRAESNELYLAQLQRLINLVALAGVIIGGTLAITAPLLIRVLYGHQYSGAAGMLSIVAVADIFVFLSVATGVWFVFEGRQTSYMTRAMMGALLNVALLLLLIPRYGGYGAAWAALSAYGYVAIVGNHLDRRTRPVAAMVLRSLTPRSLMITARTDIVGAVRSRVMSRRSVR
jgi:O-antigen/teichoic acid export membrane protein